MVQEVLESLIKDHLICVTDIWIFVKGIFLDNILIL